MIKLASDEDCKAICELHIASIKYYCADYYPETSISAWISSKSPETYRNISGHRITIIAEEDSKSDC